MIIRLSNNEVQHIFQVHKVCGTEQALIQFLLLCIRFMVSITKIMGVKHRLVCQGYKISNINNMYNLYHISILLSTHFLISRVLNFKHFFFYFYLIKVDKFMSTLCNFIRIIITGEYFIFFYQPEYVPMSYIHMIVRPCFRKGSKYHQGYKFYPLFGDIMSPAGFF